MSCEDLYFTKKALIFIRMISTFNEKHGKKYSSYLLNVSHIKKVLPLLSARGQHWVLFVIGIYVLLKR